MSHPYGRDHIPEEKDIKDRKKYISLSRPIRALVWYYFFWISRIFTTKYIIDDDDDYNDPAPLVVVHLGTVLGIFVISVIIAAIIFAPNPIFATVLSTITVFTPLVIFYLFGFTIFHIFNLKEEEAYEHWKNILTK